MDTFAEISCFSSDSEVASTAMQEAFREMKQIERLLSKHDEGSELSRINRVAGIEETKVNSELFRIIERSIYYSKLSKGNFDITVAPLVDMWNAARKNNLVPEEETIESALRCVGYKNIVMDKERLSIYFLNSATKIDLGGIAKGYAVDRAKEILLSHGIESALIDIGGNIFALGNPPGKKSWLVGIQHPRDKDEIIYKLELKNKAVSTSGDYERFFILNGERFSHIVNPLDGMPTEGIASVTVVADSAEAADALSTAVFVMGIEKGLDIIESFSGAEVFIFDRDGDSTRYP